VLKSVTLPLAVLAVLAMASAASAESTGGSLGKTGKSVSGGGAPVRSTPKAPPPAPPAQPLTKTFNHPKYAGEWVDRCLVWGSQCNQPAADEYCRRMGYARASDFAWTQMAPTRILSSGQICNSFLCGGFSRVTCTQ
jgi:hypothetical protein